MARHVSRGHLINIVGKAFSSLRASSGAAVLANHSRRKVFDAETIILKLIADAPDAAFILEEDDE